uniref:Uncharacterized protein n=1 Tax=Oryza nivara TaxID=4536 RepID=A0A0E0G1I0_ORYNI
MATQKHFLESLRAAGEPKRGGGCAGDREAAAPSPWRLDETAMWPRNVWVPKGSGPHTFLVCQAH